jgi:flagellar basal body-associated protein FliL
LKGIWLLEEMILAMTGMCWISMLLIFFKQRHKLITISLVLVLILFVASILINIPFIQNPSQADSGLSNEKPDLFLEPAHETVVILELDELASNNIANTRQNSSQPSPPYFLKTDIPDIELDEDFGMHILDLSGYAADNEDTPDKLRWFITDDNRSLINVTHENSTDQMIIIRSVTNAYGKNTVRVWVSDSSGLAAFQVFTIYITQINDVPLILDLPTLKVHRAKPYSINLRPYIVDYDTPVSTIKISVKPENRNREFASITNKHTLNLNFKSTTEFDNFAITLQLNDNINISNSKINIDLSDNSPPEQLRTIPPIILYQNEPLIKILDLDYYFNDPDHAKELLNYSYFQNEHITVKIYQDNAVDLASKDSWEGMEQFILRCVDPNDAFTEQIVNVNITCEKEPPLLYPLPDIKVHYDFEYMFNLSPYLQLDSHEIELNFELYEFHDSNWIKSTEQENIKLNADSGIILKINYSKEFLNKTIPVLVNVNVSDESFSAFQEFLVTVTDKHPPFLKLDFQNRELDEDSEIPSAINLYEYFTDSGDGSLQFSSITENVILDIQQNGLVSIASEPDWFGSERVVIRAFDNNLAMVEDSFVVDIRPINDAPKILEIGQINITQGIQATFDFINYVYDVDNEISELTISEDSEHITIAGGFLILTYPGNIRGRQQFTLTVSDGELSTQQDIDVNIRKQKLQDVVDDSPLSPFIFWGVVVFLIVMILVLMVIAFINIMRIKSFSFDEIFLIYKDGLLIATASKTKRRKKSTQDSDIFSSMFTAVQDFIHDSFSDPDRPPESWPLKRLDFGDFKIVIDRGEFLYIAAVFSGFPIKKMLQKIENLRKDIEKRFIDVLPTWSGDMAQLKGAKPMIEKFLLHKTEEEREVEKTPKKKAYADSDNDNETEIDNDVSSKSSDLDQLKDEPAFKTKDTEPDD